MHADVSDDEANEQTKDVYAHFGLAIYFAQVLEHGVVNAMIMGRMHERHRTTRSEIDAFREAQFERTLGQMLRELRLHVEVPADVEATLHAALKRRNLLAHDYFRERCDQFMSSGGRAGMLAELEEATSQFREADQALDELTRAVREKYGVDDAAIERAVNEVLSGDAEGTRVRVGAQEGATSS